MTIARRDVEYAVGDVVLRGELAWDSARNDRRPGVLVFHEGGGLNEHPKYRAGLLAQLGYVALACDMYGGGEFISDPTRRGERMGELRSDPDQLRARAHAGLEALTAQPEVDHARLAAIGFCFGGLTVLELARAGAELAGVVSFHGVLETKRPAERDAVKAKVLLLHGAEDPIAPRAQLLAFIDEMTAAHVDWQVVLYGGAQHGFTRKDAARVGLAGVAYNSEADARSWAAMQSFFAELFGGASS